MTSRKVDYSERWRTVARRSRVVCAVACVLLGVGCRSRNRAPAEAPPVWREKPAIDLSKGAAAFPLDSTVAPGDLTQLKNALMAGYAVRLDQSGATPRVTVEGDTLKALKKLKIDLSDAKVAGNYTPKAPGKALEPLGDISVERLDYVAKPLRYETHATNLTLEADDAVLSMIPDDSDKKISLALVSANRGKARFSVKIAELQKSLVSGGRARSGAAFAINDVEMYGSSDNPRSLEVYLRIHARVLLIPAKFRIGGRVDVDNHFNVLLSKLEVKGEDVGGALVAGLIEPKVMKYNNVLMPLVKWPGDRMKLTDFRISVGESLTIDAEFAKREMPTTMQP